MRFPSIIAALLVLSPSLCAAQTVATTNPSVTVTGQGRAHVPPDHANLTVEIDTKAKTAEDATTAHRERAARAVNALREMKSDGVEIAQSNFRLAELRMPPAPSGVSGQASTEYQAVTTFELKMTRVDVVDAAITKLASTGLFEIRNLRFGVSDNNPGMAEARRRAVADARERAITYTRAAGVKLGDVIKIEDLQPQGPVLFAAQAQAMRSVQVIPPENLTLSASVTITWKIAR